MLKIEGLTKKYGGKCAVDNLSLEIAEGEICGFIGHNGAGKTTTIKAVCGILRFESGEIYIGGKSVKKAPMECKRMTAYVPDNPDIYDFLSGIKYLNFIADVYGIGASERQQRIRQYADMLELTADLASPVSAYSHGMRQKLALMAALIHEPRFMVLDEPFVGLDPKASRTVKDIMRRKCDDGGAVFFSTHVLEVAEKLCDKVAIIKSGRLVAYGDMDTVRGDSSLETAFFELEGEHPALEGGHPGHGTEGHGPEAPVRGSKGEGNDD
ncbi:MAG: ABC transporter ATP-binding protein [Clostridiales Family XIII bacterium]|jgi:ABC-2 type transport system ATP-binding protein|nr:ABC transporter ATP-binding protein [Clostridiales Family XIII bacterium]